MIVDDDNITMNSGDSDTNLFPTDSSDQFSFGFEDKLPESILQDENILDAFDKEPAAMEQDVDDTSNREDQHSEVETEDGHANSTTTDFPANSTATDFLANSTATDFPANSTATDFPAVVGETEDYIEHEQEGESDQLGDIDVNEKAPEQGCVFCVTGCRFLIVIHFVFYIVSSFFS